MSWYQRANTDRLANILQNKIEDLIASINLAAITEKVRAVGDQESKGIPKYLIGEIDGFSIFIVDGNAVKTELEMDFVEGANDEAYSSDTDDEHKDVIPDKEVWLSAEVNGKYIPYILYHELLEAIIMRSAGLSYSDAHDIANAHEKKARESKIFG